MRKMMKNKEDCDHFWEIVFPIIGNSKKQKHKCMKCGKEKDRSIPILLIPEEKESWDDKINNLLRDILTHHNVVNIYNLAKEIAKEKGIKVD
jgi:hypothetical protein